MIASMTGFGRAVVELKDKKITLELKSLNSKQFDLNARMPSIYKEKEMEMRKLISENLQRGKIDFFVLVENNPGTKNQFLNTEVIKSYIDDLKSIHDSGDEMEYLSLALRLPDSVQAEQREQMPKEEWEAIKKGLLEAIKNIKTYRNDEGNKMAIDLLGNIEFIESNLKKVPQFESERLENTKNRLRTQLANLEEKPDNNRFEQELIYYMEKLDINEEKVRLKANCDYFKEMIDTDSSNGKKLGFICQEIGREINTLGAKCNHSELQKIVVEMKEALEKIKEQILNVL